MRGYARVRARAPSEFTEEVVRRKVVYWSLFNRDEKNQLDDLRTDQVEAIWAAVAKGQRPQWMIWREGFKTWKPFEDFPLLLEDLRKASAAVPHPLPPEPPKKIEDQEREIEAMLDNEFKLTTTKRNPSLADNRKQGRYEGKFKVRVRAGEHVFRTYTANISIEGMLLQRPLPSWVPKYFTLELSLDDSTIPLLCSAAKGSGRDRSRVRIESNDNCEILRRWMVATTY